MNEQLKFAFAYAKIKPLQRTIIEYLCACGKHEGNYTTLAAAIGQKVTHTENGKVIHGNEPNVRKAVLSLCQCGIVMFNKSIRNGKEESYFALEDNWTEIVVNL